MMAILHPRIGIFAKILISYVALSIVPAVAVGVFSYRSAVAMLHNHIIQSSEGVLRGAARNIDFVLDDGISLVNFVMMDQDIEHSLIQPNMDGFDQVVAVASMESILFQYASAVGNIPFQITLWGRNGLTATNAGQESPFTNSKLRNLPWYSQVKPSNKQLSWIGVHSNYTVTREQGLMFSAAKAMTDPYSGLAYGILVLSIPEEYLRSLYLDTANPSSLTELVDANGKIMSSSSPEAVASVLDEQTYSFMRSPYSSSVLRFERRNFLYLKVPLQHGGLTLVQRIPLERLQGDVYNLRDRLVFVFVITLLLSVFCAFLVSRQISSPLIRLRNRLLATNQTPVSPSSFVAAVRPNEWYFSEYNNLIAGLENTVNQLVHEQQQKRKAEIHALQMQINPHFLFNTLKSLKCLVWTQRYERIEPTINALIRLLQQSLHDTDELETLEAQFTQLKEFVYIQEVRLDHELNVTYQCSDSARYCRMPKLVLQPIVENAIVHGIERKVDTGKIWVNATVINGDVLVEVIDNGVGCEQSQVDEILGNSTAETQAIWSHHIGLRNVNARLQSFFGPGYSVKFRTNQGAGTSVTLHFPAIT